MSIENELQPLSSIGGPFIWASMEDSCRNVFDLAILCGSNSQVLHTLHIYSQIYIFKTVFERMIWRKDV